MASIKLTKKTIKNIDTLVGLFADKKDTYERFAGQIFNFVNEYKLLKPHIHSIKYRVKDPEHLREKLLRKATLAKKEGKAFDITPDNFFEKIEDFAGVRLLHLHTTQVTEIDIALRELFNEENLNLVEGPIANTWDIEYREFFKKLSMRISERETMYTSVHYVIEANNKYGTRCELQVRTLMEEVWGEVSHKIDYPEETDSIACKEQLKVLARVTSSGTRLVDSIFESVNEYHDLIKNTKPTKKIKIIKKKRRRSP